MALAIAPRQSAAKRKKNPNLSFSMPDGESRRLWTRDEYYRMAEQGILKPGEKTELIEGEIFQKMSPMGAPHRTVVHLVEHTLEKIFESGYYVDTQVPTTFSDISEPEPDVYVAKGSVEDYADHHPGAEDIVLAVEVSDSSLRLDRTRKAALFAKYGIPEYWIVNLIDRQLEVHREPQGGKYLSIVVLGEAEFVSPLAALEEKIRVGGLLPKGK